MGAAAILSRLRQDGFAVVAGDGKVIVRPASALTDADRAEITRHREELLQRLLDPDPRVTCTSCRHYRPHRCGNHVAALLMNPDVGPALAALPQRCPGFAPAAPHPLAAGRNQEDTKS